MAILAANNIFIFSAMAKFSKLDINLKVGSKILLFLFSKRGHFFEFDIGYPSNFFILLIDIDKCCIEDITYK